MPRQAQQLTNPWPTIHPDNSVAIFANQWDTKALTPALVIFSQVSTRGTTTQNVCNSNTGSLQLTVFFFRMQPQA